MYVCQTQTHARTAEQMPKFQGPPTDTLIKLEKFIPVSLSEPSIFPWDTEKPNPDTVYMLSIDRIQIPEPRVTSVFTPQQQEEFLDSLKTEGQKLPIELILVKGQLWLADGLNRILGLKELGVKEIKALVKSGTESDVQIANIITARHRGKENPAQTAEVIHDLIENVGMPREIVCKRLGMSKSWMEKLYKISKLPPEVKDHIKYGRLSVASAVHLTMVDNTAELLLIADQAVTWGYNEEQTKLRVWDAINPDKPPENAGFTFAAGGAPQPLYPRCLVCNNELKGESKFIWLCSSDLELIKNFVVNYNSEPPSSIKS